MDSPILLGRLTTARLDVAGVSVDIVVYSKSDQITAPTVAWRNVDQLGVSKVSIEGRRLGFPEWWLDNWGADGEDVTPGTGFIRVFGGDAREHSQLMIVIQTAAELRPR